MIPPSVFYGCIMVSLLIISKAFLLSFDLRVLSILSVIPSMSLLIVLVLSFTVVFLRCFSFYLSLI